MALGASESTCSSRRPASSPPLPLSLFRIPSPLHLSSLLSPLRPSPRYRTASSAILLMHVVSQDRRIEPEGELPRLANHVVELALFLAASWSDVSSTARSVAAVLMLGEPTRPAKSSRHCLCCRLPLLALEDSEHEHAMESSGALAAPPGSSLAKERTYLLRWFFRTCQLSTSSCVLNAINSKCMLVVIYLAFMSVVLISSRTISTNF